MFEMAKPRNWWESGVNILRYIFQAFGYILGCGIAFYQLFWWYGVCKELSFGYPTLNSLYKRDERANLGILKVVKDKHSYYILREKSVNYGLTETSVSKLSWHTGSLSGEIVLTSNIYNRENVNAGNQVRAKLENQAEGSKELRKQYEATSTVGGIGALGSQGWGHLLEAGTLAHPPVGSLSHRKKMELVPEKPPSIIL